MADTDALLRRVHARIREDVTITSAYYKHSGQHFLSVTWRRLYPCGQLSDERWVGGITLTLDDALREVLRFEDARVSREQIVNAERYGPMRSVQPRERRRESA